MNPNDLCYDLFDRNLTCCIIYLCNRIISSKLYATVKWIGYLRFSLRVCELQAL